MNGLILAVLALAFTVAWCGTLIYKQLEDIGQTLFFIFDHMETHEEERED